VTQWGVEQYKKPKNYLNH